MRELRRVGWLAGVLGQTAAAVAGVLPWPALPVVALLYAAGVLAAERASDRQARLMKSAGTVLALVCALVMLPGVTADRDTLRTTLGLLLVMVQTAHGLLWRARRDVEVGLAIAAALLVLGASFAPDVLVGLPLVAGWLVVVAGAVLAAEQRMRERSDVVVAGGRRAPLAAATSSALLLALAAALVIPVPETPAQRNSPIAFASGTGPGRGALTYASSRLDLRVRGTLSDEPVLEVPADSPPLWRSQVFGLYSGLSWSSTSGALRPVPGPPWVIGAGSGTTREDVATKRGPLSGPVWAPAEPVSLDGRRGFVLTDGAGTARSTGLRTYTVVSAPQEQSPQVLRAATGIDDVSRLWLQLPPALPERLRALSAQLTGAAPTRFDAVAAVEHWLRANATYSLDSPVPGRGEDAVDRFLFVDKVGFCEQFAAAETVLLRAAGIPARLATGLAAGVPGEDGKRIFREQDLHAWVEVYYPGVGWSPSDPTAGVALAGGAGGTVRQRLAAALDAAVRTAESVPGGRVGLAVLLAVAALAVGLWARLYRPRRPRDVESARPAPGPAPGPALAAFLRYDESLGERRRRPSESLRELSRRLGPEPAAALAVVETECYGAAPPADAARAGQVLDRLAAAPADRVP